MNERIQELIEQSKCLSDGYNTGAIDMEKFAELIIEECAMVAVECDVTEYGDFREDISQKIKRHFGVEE